MKHTIIALAAGVALAVPLAAQDGVIEINQASATAGGVTPGDTPGFPVTISLPGSYRLTSNLDISSSPPTPAVVVHITADDVTVDLNGFGLIGATVCTYTDGQPGSVLCSPESTPGAGVYANVDVDRARVTSGFVRGMSDYGILLERDGEVTAITASSNGGVGILAARVDHSRALLNGGTGILANSHVAHSVADRNGDDGIQTGLAVDSQAVNNHDVGLIATQIVGCAASNNNVGFELVGGLLADSRASSNASFGAVFTFPGGYRGNVFAANNSAGIQVSGGTSLGPNFCQTAVCP